MKGALNLASAIAGVAAALLWFHASRVLVDDDPNDHSFKITEKKGSRTINVLNTAKAQTFWNAWASTAAAIAAILQVIVPFLPQA